MKLILGALVACAVFGQPMSLRQAVERTGELNPDVAIARLRILESQADAEAVKAEHLPQLTGRVGASYNTNNLQGIGLVVPGFPSRLGPYRLFDARPVLTQTILDGGLVSRIRAAREQFAASRYNAEAVRETTQLAVMELYFGALQAESRVMASKARLATAKAVLQQAVDKEQGGAASKLDVARATEELENETGTLANTERDLRTLKTSLARLIGVGGGDSFDLVTIDRKGFETLPPAPAATEAAITTRAETARDQAEIRRADQEVEQAKREYWPKIGFAGDFGALGQGPENSVSTYSVGATMTFPIWTSGRIEKQIAAAKARKQQVEEQARNTKLGIEEDARRALIEWQAARDVLAAASKASAAARESVELARLRFESGLSTNIDTVTAQSRQAQADDYEIRTRYEVLRAKARYYRAQGSVSQFFEGL